jgi:hypothetical protein
MDDPSTIYVTGIIEDALGEEMDRGYDSVIP